MSGLGPDGRLLFGARALRMFGFGFLSVVLVLYLVGMGLSDLQVGLVLTVALLGDVLLSLWLTVHADRLGRRRVLVGGALLMVAAGVMLASTSQVWLLLLVAFVGVISPSGHEVGPFLAVEQASLSQIVPGDQRTRAFGWYSLTGSLATAFGALSAGLLGQWLGDTGMTAIDADRMVVVGYALAGALLAAVAWRLSPAIEARVVMDTTIGRRLGLHRSRSRVLRLSLLFGLDAFGGGFVIQTILAYWLSTRWGVGPAALGIILFATNLLAAASALLARPLAARLGLLRTMVYTHLPSNILLILLPFMPSLPLTVLALLIRFGISQVDVPARQSYVMGIVEPDERSAAAGITGVARSVGAAIAPTIAAPLVAVPGMAALPFVVAGCVKIVFDVLLLLGFRDVRPPEEEAQRVPSSRPSEPSSQA